jgi:hypothetical protein
VKLRSLEDDGANICNAEEEAFVSFGKLARLTSVDSNLSNGLSFLKHGNPENGRYSLCQCYFRILNSFVFGGIGNEYHFAVKDIREAFMDIKRAFLEIEVAKTIGAHGNQILLFRVEG